MTVKAYIRVSTSSQDVANQRHGVSEYAKMKGFELDYVEDTASGKKDWRDRELGALLETMQAGDVLLVAEVSRLARSTQQVLEILSFAASREISVHIVKNGMVMDNSMQAKITATILGLAGEIERDFISERTKEALAYRKSQGKPIGRMKGRKNKKHKIGKVEANKIERLLAKGVKKTEIAKQLNISRNTLYIHLRAKEKDNKHHAQVV